jgi:hypothetical protein
MSTQEEIKQIVKTLKSRKDLKKYEKDFLKIYEENICDEERVKKLQLIGRDKYIEKNYKADIKEAGRKFVKRAEQGNNSLKGDWREAPPPPPQFPEDCIIM